MQTYDQLREEYEPTLIKILFIAESPPPAANVQSSRHFYRTEKIRKDDRLFTNTIKALYSTASTQTEAEIQKDKEKWLRTFQADGYYMIEALEESQVHKVTKQDRQVRIKQNLPHLLQKVQQLAHKSTGIILIKSNVYEVAAEPLRQAGFAVLNTSLVDYPGRFNQLAYRKKLAALVSAQNN